MSEKKKLNLVLCWHMHQPWYRETLTGEYRLPWVYLHALKDYSDMVAHLEAHPKMRTVVNFTPVLLEQLEDYSAQLHDWLHTGEPMQDPMLNLLAGVQTIPIESEARKTLVMNCLRAHAPQMIDPHESFRRLLAPLWNSGMSEPDFGALPYLNDQFFLDVLTWYHLAWLGFSERKLDWARSLMKQGGLFTVEQRRELLQRMADLIGGLAQRYKMLADKGQIELSVTPYYHPIVPLLLDFDTRLCTQHEAPGPAHGVYPGGAKRAHWHMQHGIEVFERFFERKPTGVWLSEGSVSDESVQMLPQFGIRWTASGEGVWHNSRALSDLEHNTPDARHNLFSPHQLPDTETRLFFRDDGLSDLIGFEYQDWGPEDAVEDFIKHLCNIRDYLGEKAHEHVVSVILDGENAWEYYPDNAFHFIGRLYERLVQCEEIEITTFDEALGSCPTVDLPKLCPGSWVYGSFSTWIGEADKNRAWDRLVEAKIAYDGAMAEGRLDAQQAQQAGLQLAICEGSDWFWWFGDYNPSDSVRDFDELYRQQLKNLYEILGKPVPGNLDEPLSQGGGAAENAGTMRRGRD